MEVHDSRPLGLGALRASGERTAPGASEPVAGDFAARLVDALRSADQLHKQAEQSAETLALGRGDVVETMVALTKADLSLRFAVNVRNRALEAYQEIMRLPL